MSGGYVYIWEFHVRPDRVEEFELIYGAEGDWVRLLRRAEGYEDTQLLRDEVDGYRYLTIDRWRSKDDYVEFRRRFGAEYDEVDERCVGLSSEERLLGSFTDCH